jgi:hypothetical protein
MVGCFDSGDPEINKLNSDPSLLLPIKGGQQIIQFPTSWTDAGDGSYNIFNGTLGFLAIDNEDGKIVGVTNAHVACYEKKQNSDRLHDYSIDDPPYNLHDPRKWPPNSLSFSPGLVVQNGGTLFGAFTGIKRYSPYKASPAINYVDAALLVPNSSSVGVGFSSDSSKIHQPLGTEDLGGFFPFASTNEIDELLTTDPTLYSTGRTTGPKGWGDSDSCKLQVDSIFVNIANVGFKDKEISYNVAFSDTIKYRHIDSSDMAIGQGDSGSVLLAKFGTTIKIIGLVFAGSIIEGQTTGPYGYACRIDRVAAEMNIRSWNSNDTVNFNNGSVSIITRGYGDGDPNEPYIIQGGHKYYNIGLRGQ